MGQDVGHSEGSRWVFRGYLYTDLDKSSYKHGAIFWVGQMGLVWAKIWGTVRGQGGSSEVIYILIFWFGQMGLVWAKMWGTVRGLVWAGYGATCKAQC